MRKPYIYSVQAVGLPGRTLHYITDELPAWLQFNSVNHRLYGTSDKVGQYPIRVSVSDGDTTVVQRFMLTVSDNRTTRILCLGNSITNGTKTYNSYRRKLWRLLHAGQYNFDLIGSWNKHHMGAEMPNPDFDLDHEGHSGWTLQHVFSPPSWDSARGNMTRWLTIYKPDMVLLELGTNDVFQCRTIEETMTDLQQIVKQLRDRNSTVRLFIAHIPPLGKQWSDKKLCGNDIPYQERVDAHNKAVAELVARLSTHKSLIAVVDQYTGVNPETDMYDDIHPNEKGEDEMALRWFRAIEPHLSKVKP